MPDSPLIIFDCDGVLVDSEPVSNRVIAEEVTKMSYPLTTEEALRLFAGGSIQNVADFIAAHVTGPKPDDFEALYRRRTAEVFRQELESVHVKVCATKNIRTCPTTVPKTPAQ